MMEIDRMLTISTAHISPKTRALLDEPQDIEILDKAVVYNKGEYGWFIYPTEHAGTHPLPADLQACINFAKNIRLFRSVPRPGRLRSSRLARL